MTVLIPAYEPDGRLIKLVTEIRRETAYSVVIVNDGSGSDFQNVFLTAEEMGCTVLTHDRNFGKGHALKTGFSYIRDNKAETEGVVTADADGQHLVADIIRVAETVVRSPDNKLVLGVRRFAGKVPLRSRIGNAVTRMVFSAVSGQSLADTQTGLRGFPTVSLQWLIGLDGERFEYEMNMLLYAKTAGYRFEQVDIQTVYLPGNTSSHFRTIRDSVLVYLPFFKFCLSGISSATVDYTLLFVFQGLTHNLFVSVLGARIASSAVNFTLNRTYVFQEGERVHKKTVETLYYYLLVAVLMLFNYLLLRFLSQDLRMNLFLSKVLTEIVLFIFSFTIQHLIVFRKAAVS